MEKRDEERTVVLGKTPSKSNLYRIGHKSLYKTKTLTDYERNFILQLPSNLRDLNYEGVFEFDMDVFYPTNASDLDNSCKIVLDCLQTAKVIKNDNKCIKILLRKFVDKQNPRVEFKFNFLQ